MKTLAALVFVCALALSAQTVATTPATGMLDDKTSSFFTVGNPFKIQMANRLSIGSLVVQVEPDNSVLFIDSGKRVAVIYPDGTVVGNAKRSLRAIAEYMRSLK